MPTEAEAGNVLWKAGERANREVAKTKGRNSGLHQGGTDCHGIKETKICHSKETVSRAFFLQHSYISKLPLLSRKSCKFPHQCLNQD